MALTISPVAGKADLEDFLRIPYRIYAGDENYVHPLLSEQRAFLDPGHNPFFAHAVAQLWVARDGRTPVGRVAACVDRYHNETHEERTGFFGFFESPDDRLTAQALLEAAETWLREQGMDTIRGPACFTTNHDYLGLLVEGEISPPVIGMPYQPRYYQKLLADYGFQKCKDLWAWRMDASDMKIPEKLVTAMEAAEKSGMFRVRPFDMARFDDEARTVRDLYNACWSKNWGFIPMDEAEFAYAAKDMKQMVDADMLLIAEAQGKPVGFCLTIPDFNQALKSCRGKLFPLGWLKFLLKKRTIDYARTPLMGVLPAFRGRGLDGAMVYKTYRAAFTRGINRGECSWILEDNEPMNRILEGLGADCYKTYRIYDLYLGT
jgi:GNAT superfamily N-acetyltransferase